MGLLQVPEWLPYGETQHVTGDNDPIYGANGTINKCPKTLWGHLQALARGVDTLVVEWVSASSVKVLEGGVCWADDGSQGYQVESDIIVSLSGLSASSAYFLWIGDDDGAIAVECGDVFDDSTVPSNLSSVHRIPGWFLTYGSGNVTQFYASPLPRLSPGIHEWPGTYAPYGACFCDGTARTRTGAPFDRGFAMFGITYGVGDGSTTYNVVDKRGRCGIGAGQGSGLTNRTLGQTIGEESHALTEAEGPEHDHVIDSSNTRYGGAIANTTKVLTGNGSEGTNDIQVASSGNGTAHNTMQPSVVMNYILVL